jgi:Ca-activated chloride channel family protein
VDEADVERVQRKVRSHLQTVRAESAEERWRDFGYYFTFPIVLLTLVWFRRGWTTNWAPVALFAVGLSGCSAGTPTSAASGFRLVDLWLTADQQGRYYLDRGEVEMAAGRFEDRLWQGIAYYEAGDYESAVDAFVRLQTPEAYLGLGTAFARLGSYEQAVSSYDDALGLRPNWVEARENRELVAGLIPPPPDEADEAPPPGRDPTFEADDYVFDEEGENGSRGDVPVEGLSDEQIAEMWLRRLQTSPAEFLRSKFALQAARAAQAADGTGR